MARQNVGSSVVREGATLPYTANDSSLRQWAPPWLRAARSSKMAVDFSAYGLLQWDLFLKTLASSGIVLIPPDVIPLQLCTPRIVGVYFKLYTVYNQRLK
jgi:hypothetical protein